MSGDVQTRQRRKEKKKQKREDEATVPGIDTSKFNETEKKSVQMHIQEDGHHGDHGGAGICAKIIFFTLMAILLGLVTLIVLENRGGSDVDTPLSESRFSEYLQGWVDENRQDDHHDEPHVQTDDHDEEHDNLEESHHEEDHLNIPEDEPYPEERDVSNNDNEPDESQELNAEINNNNESNQEDQDEGDQNASQEEETYETADQNDDDEEDKNNNDDDTNDDAPEASDDGNNNNNDEDDDEPQDNKNDEEIPNIFEDSAPFDEEQPKINRHHLVRQVDELYDTYNEIANMLGKDKMPTNKRVNKEAASKGDDDDDDNNKDIFENVVDNDAGEDILLQKLAEESEMAQQEQKQEDQENEEEGSSSLMVKLGVGVLLAIVAHQIIIKKISATNRSSDESDILAQDNDNALSRRRFTMLSNSEERLVNEEMDNEEIIEVMMITTPNVVGEKQPVDDEQFTESDAEEFSEELIDEEEELEDEEYSEEIVDEVEPEIKPRVPKTFEDFNNMYKPQSAQIEEVKRTAKFDEPKAVEQEVENEVEERILAMPETSVPKQMEPPKGEIKESIISSQEEGQLEPEIDIEDMEDDELGEEEEEEISGDELIDEDDLDYEESDEDLSDIDDADLLKRLEAKYGKLDNSDKSNEEENDEASWTKIPEGGGAQNSYMEELLRQQSLEENPTIKVLYEKAKELDELAEKQKSNKKLLEAIETYKTLIEQYGDKLNDTIYKQVAERCIERMRFLGKLKPAVDIHHKLIRRFVNEPSFRNQLAVTFLLGNRLSAAKLVLHEVLSQWRFNGFALVHYGFVLKNLDQDYENAVLYLREGIETEEEGTQDGRFYFNLGDALQRLGRQEEAMEVYRKGAALGIFLSEYQRSLYNVNRLKSKPFWTKLETTYKDDFTEIHKYWQVIRDEGLKLLSRDGVFMNEQENLKDTGDWKQFELYSRGAKTKNCHLAPITCQLIRNFKAASTCKRGQVKFSVMHPNTHVHSHCGPTNCRIRAHLGLQVPKNTFIRVANETRSWKDGEWLIFDDSYEHEVWHNGTSVRLVLIVDVWHPDLTEDERSSMSAI